MAEIANQEAVTNPAAERQQSERTFTQDEMHAIISDRLNRERAKYADSRHSGRIYEFHKISIPKIV